MMKRLCLFAGYDEQCIIDKYVVYYVKMLSLVSDVYFYADCNMPPEELAKLNGHAVRARAGRHSKYDFGSWQELMLSIDPEKMSEYDEMLLVNDSCFGPLFPLDPIFKKMNNDKYDFWGLTKNHEIKPHLQSYFLVFKNKVFTDSSFKEFFSRIEKQESNWGVILKYEVELTGYLEGLGYKYGFLYENIINPTFYFRTLIKTGVPVLKIKVLKEKNFTKENPLFWKFIIRKTSGYDLSLINDYLKRYRINIIITGYYYAKNRIRQFIKWIINENK